MITICRTTGSEGTWYEITDFGAYVQALQEHGIEEPLVKYRVFLPHESGQLAGAGDLEGQVAAFFRLGHATGISYQVVEHSDSGQMASAS